MVYQPKKILITGISSGIGQALAQQLEGNGYKVFGVSRRNGYDVSKKGAWEKIVLQMKKAKFTPDVVVFNAAINPNDLSSTLDLTLTKKIFAVNFFSILEGIKILTFYVKPHTHFITISSTSAFKGGSFEGVGYASSKAALSIAFESLYQHYKNKFLFSTIYFGPVKTKMRLGRKNPPLTLSKEQAAKNIIEVIENKTPIAYYPRVAFLLVKLIKLLPFNMHLRIFPVLEKRYVNP